MVVIMRMVNSSFASLTNPEGVYLNVPNRNNEAFLFDTIMLKYSTTNPVLFLNIYNLTEVADGDKSRLSPFKNKFVGSEHDKFCILSLQLQQWC
jgi:hypothetical protein